MAHGHDACRRSRNGSDGVDIEGTSGSGSRAAPSAEAAADRGATPGRPGRASAPLVHRLAAWLAGTALAYALASVVHTHTVLAGLGELGVRVGLAERLATTLGDLVGLYLYAAVIGAGLAIALIAVRLLARLDPALPLWLQGAIAGTLAIAVALLAMRLGAGFTPIASAREPLGFTLQCLAGTAGGLAWAAVRRRLSARRVSARE